MILILKSYHYPSFVLPNDFSSKFVQCLCCARDFSGKKNIISYSNTRVCRFQRTLFSLPRCCQFCCRASYTTQGDISLSNTFCLLQFYRGYHATERNFHFLRIPSNFYKIVLVMHCSFRIQNRRFFDLSLQFQNN